MAIIFKEINGTKSGELNSFEMRNHDKSEIGIREAITRHIKAQPGKEREVEHLFEQLENKIIVIEGSSEPSIADLTGGLLLRPSIRGLIGFSEGTSFNTIPEWMHYPVLRLANLIKIGNTCNHVGIASTKLEYGSSALAGPTFAAASGQFLPDHVAGYILSGSFNMDIGKMVHNNPSIINSILNFRDSNAGVSLRKDVLKCLSINNGGDFVTAVNGAMDGLIPISKLEDAKGKMASLLIANGVSSNQIVPAVWNDNKYANDALHLWKRRSNYLLNEYNKKNGVNDYDCCPCGSGDKLKYCCKEALKM